MAPLFHEDDKQVLRFAVKATIAALALAVLFACVLQLASSIPSIARLHSSVAALALIPMREPDDGRRGYADLIFSGAIFAIAFCVSYEFLGGLAGVAL